MSRTFHHGERRIRVKGVRRHPADLRKLARALIALAQAEAEAAAEEEYGAAAPEPSRPRPNKATKQSPARTADQRRPEAEGGRAA